MQCATIMADLCLRALQGAGKWDFIQMPQLLQLSHPCKLTPPCLHTYALHSEFNYIEGSVYTGQPQGKHKRPPSETLPYTKLAVNPAHVLPAEKLTGVRCQPPGDAGDVRSGVTPPHVTRSYHCTSPIGTHRAFAWYASPR